MKNKFFLIIKILALLAAAAAVFAATAGPADESGFKDPTILGVYEEETPPPREAEYGSYTADEMTPQNLRARVDGMKVVLTWDKTEKGLFYNVFRSTAESGGFKSINIDGLKDNMFVDAPGTSIFPPKSGIMYYYIVKATDGSYVTAGSNVAQAMIGGALEPPSDITLISRETSVTIKWAAPAAGGENGINGYNIFRGQDETGGIQITRTASTAYEFIDATGLTTGVKYYYRLQTIDSKGFTSRLSDPLMAVPYTGISSPKNVTVSAASTESIKLQWNEPESQGTFGLKGYQIFRSTDAAAFPSAPVNERIVKPYEDAEGRLFYYDNIINSDVPPEPGVQYYYKVVPVDAEGHTGDANAPVTGKIEYMKIEKSGILSANISEYGLPPDSNLKLSGMKSIKFALDVKIWDESVKNRDQVTTPPTIEQPLRLMLNGNIGSKIFVDINYDDSKAAIDSAEDKKISIRYMGEKDETLQELSFGDINFDIPSVRYVRPLASLFGIKGKAAFLDNRLKISGAWAQTKGITDIQEFQGTMREMQTNGSPGITINDINFIANTYYYLTKDVSKITALDPYHVPSVSDPAVSVEPGSVLVYIDDQYVTSDNLNTVITPSGNFHLDRKELGSDYTVDYKNGVIKFNFGISANYIVAVAYRLTDSNGALVESVGYDGSGNFDFTEANLVSAPDGFTSNSAHLIKANGNDISHMVMNYYYMGATQINNPSTDEGFDIKIYKTNVDQGVPRPWEPNADKYYEIDSNFGIIKFKNFYPFSINSSGIIYTGPSSITGNDLDAYNVNRASAVSVYKMFFKYRYNISSYRLDYSPVIANSERVFLDNRLLKKDTDYQILYETGDIVFVDKNLITEKSLVKIVYEYSPFIQTFESTVLGARLDYDVLDNLKIGATYIRKDSTKGTEPPDARSTEVNLSTPFGGFVADANVSFDLKKDNINYILSSLPLVGKTDLPVDFRFDAEAAYSDLNANTFDWKNEKGIAMIDNMEGADNERSMNMIDTAWFPASLPSGRQPVNRVFTTRDSYDDQGHEKTQSFSQGYTPSTVKILRVNYSGLTDLKWDALRQNISVAGENLHNYSYLEMWVKVKTDKPVMMNVDIGVISEDSNGNNAFLYNTLTPFKRNDSEDTITPGQNKPSGYLDDNEDIGIGPGVYSGYPGSTDAYWGAGNDILDSEDLNNNGSLDVTEKFYRYGAIGAAGYHPGHPEMVFTNRDEWVNIRIPLNQITDSLGLTPEERDGKNTQFLSLIKHIRFTLMGTGSSPSSGTLEIESIKFIGNSWQLAVPSPGISDGAGNVIDSPDTSKFDAFAVKKSTESSYQPNLNFFEWQTEDDKNYEESLKIKYTLSGYDLWGTPAKNPIYYVRKPYNAAIGYDYRPYKYLKVDVFYKVKDYAAGPGRTMFIRLGQDGANENRNYYQFNEQLDGLVPGVWQTVVFRIDGSDKKRSQPVDLPNLRQINMITIGFINPNTQAATEEFYINNIRLTDPDPKQGSAKYMSSTLNMAGIGSVVHTFEDKETDFNSIEDITKSQMRRHSTINSVRFNPSFLPFLNGFTNAYSRTQDFIEEKYKDDLSYTANQSVPDTDVESYESIFGINQFLGLTFGNNMRYIRQKDTYYGDKKDQSNKTDRFIWQPNGSWTPPRDFFFIPLGSNKFDSYFELNSYVTKYLGVQNAVYYDSWKMTLRQRYRWQGGYDIWKITITPVYEYILDEGKGNMAGYDYWAYALGVNYYTPEYLVLKRDILPSLNIRLNDAWIFSPSIAYASTYRLDYGSGQLNTTGRLEAYSGLALSQLLSFLPNISRYSFMIDVNETYDNRYDTEAFSKFEALTFERKWSAFLWKMLYDDNEMKALEDISLRGAINITHSISLDNINFGDILSFNPRGTYSKYRSSSGRTLQDPTESWTLDFGSIQIKKITIPGLEFIVKDKTISAGYSFRKDITRRASNPAEITKDSVTHNGRMTFYYGIDGSGLGGNLGFGIDRTDSIDNKVKNWSIALAPTASVNYVLRKEDPFTVWDWFPVIGGKVFKFEQNLNLTLNAGYSYRENETNGLKNKTGTFSTSLTGNYNVLQNLKTTAAISFSAYKDYITNTNSYKMITISLGGDLEF